MALQGKYTWKGVDLDEAYVVIKDVSASNLEISFIQESINDGETKRFSCHEVLEEEDLVRISGNGLKFSFSYLEMS